MKKLTVRKFAEWLGSGQFRTILLLSENVFLIGGVNPISGPRSSFQAIAVSLRIQDAHEVWRMALDKSKPFQHAVVHDNRLFVIVPSNFTRSFTGYLEVDTANGTIESQSSFEEVILGSVSIGNKLFFGTALHGVYRVFSCDNGERSDFPRMVKPNFWLKSVARIANDILVISEFDRTLSKLIYTHSAFNLNGELLWKVESSLLNIASVGSRFLIWDDESAAVEVFDSTTGQLLSVIELAGSPLEHPVSIGEYGFAYACPDCSIHVRSWDGEDQEIFRQTTTGSIALAYDKLRNILVAAFSGNNKDTNTSVSIFKLEGV
jgi:hypothetical protein